jgi:hypothetical protein
MAPATADSSEDEGEGLNQEIPQLDRAAYDALLTAVQKAGFNIGTFLQALFAPPQRGSWNSQKHIQMQSRSQNSWPVHVYLISRNMRSTLCRSQSRLSK